MNELIKWIDKVLLHMFRRDEMLYLFHVVDNGRDRCHVQQQVKGSVGQVGVPIFGLPWGHF